MKDLGSICYFLGLYLTNLLVAPNRTSSIVGEASKGNVYVHEILILSGTELLTTWPNPLVALRAIINLWAFIYLMIKYNIGHL